MAPPVNSIVPLLRMEPAVRVPEARLIAPVAATLAALVTVRLAPVERMSFPVAVGEREERSRDFMVVLAVGPVMSAVEEGSTKTAWGAAGCSETVQALLASQLPLPRRQCRSGVKR